jgi:heat shock protein HslJ
MSLQRLSSRRDEQVGQKREWCSEESEQPEFAIGSAGDVVSGAGVVCIRKY